MRASDGVLKQIAAGLENGDDSAFIKYAKRYGKDAELSRIWARYDAEADMAAAAEKIKKLKAARKIRSKGGTSIGLKDRRELIASKKPATRD